MFRSTFQGGPVVEVLSAAHNLSSLYHISRNVKKEFNSLAKTFVYFMKGESTLQQITIPKDNKKKLGLTQPCVVFQLHLFDEDRFSLEIRVSCNAGCSKRIVLSTHRTHLQITPLFAMIPLNIANPRSWQHLCVNVVEITSIIWHERTNTIDGISVYGNGNLRQIYTVHENMVNEKSSNGWERYYIDNLPKQCRFPLNVPQIYHLISKPYVGLCMEGLNVKKSNTSASKSNSTRGSKTRACSGDYGSFTSSSSKFSTTERCVKSNTMQKLGATSNVKKPIRPLSMPQESPKMATKPSVYPKLIVVPEEMKMQKSPVRTISDLDNSKADSSSPSSTHSLSSTSSSHSQAEERTALAISNLLPRYAKAKESKAVYIPPLSIAKEIMKEEENWKENDDIDEISIKENLNRMSIGYLTNQKSPHKSSTPVQLDDEPPIIPLSSKCVLVTDESLYTSDSQRSLVPSPTFSGNGDGYLRNERVFDPKFPRLRSENKLNSTYILASELSSDESA